jgi:hypothetical protein
MIVRAVVAILIVFVALYDPTSALLLTIVFVMIIQSMNKYHIANVGNSTLMREEFNIQPPVSHESPLPKEENNLQLGVYQETQEQEQEQGNVRFTTNNQLNTCQTDVVGDVNTEVRTWDQEMGPQGGGEPGGFDTSAAFSRVVF